MEIAVGLVTALSDYSGGHVRNFLSIQRSSVLWILCSLHQQSVLASLLVLPPVSIPASCERGSRWFLSPRPDPPPSSSFVSCRRPRPPGSVPVLGRVVSLSPSAVPRFILHPSACGGAEDERAREGFGIRLCRGPSTGVGYLQRLAF